jgi:transposase
MATVQRQAARIEELEKEVERLKRKGKRQAAPFSKGPPKSQPKKPGRKPGKNYGQARQREVPKQVSETVRVACPLYCSDCESQVQLEDLRSQYQIDLPPMQPQITKFEVEIGRCLCCGRRVQGRHPRQVSDALDIGRVHFGPGVLGLAAHLNKICGLSYGKIANLLGSWMGVSIERSTLCRALQRFAEKARPTYDALASKVRGSPVVAGDETGWKLAGLLAWLWGFTTGRETVYRICRGRGYDEARQVLGDDFEGVLVVDGWAPYRKFESAMLQACLTHMLRRCSKILESATRGAVRFPRAVRDILETALSVRDRRDRGELTPQGVLSLRGRLQAQMSRLLQGRYTNPENARFAKHLRNYEEALFVFLSREDVEATNWQAEHAMRAAVMTRKTCGGGNRTVTGAQTQAILMSVLRTSHQKDLEPLQVAKAILCASTPEPHMELVNG